MYFLRHNLRKLIGQQYLRDNLKQLHPKQYSQHQRPTNDENHTKFNNEESQSNSRTTDDENNIEQKQLMLKGSFENISDKNRKSYMEMIKIFEKRDVHRRNHVEFIYAALKNMESFGVHRDLEVYKTLIDVLPKGKFIPTNIIQAEFMHYPKQQQVIIDLLEQMEDNGVIPDYEIEDILLNIFGKRGHPLRKFWRMMYWMPKFKNASPWPLPNPVPNDSLELARLAIERMCTVDLQSKVTVYETKDIDSSIDDTWIVSGISREQQKLLENHKITEPIRIEGPFFVWLRNKSINYFILRGETVLDSTIVQNVEQDEDDVSNLRVPTFGQVPEIPKKLKRSVHQQDDGTIFAICATGTSTKDSLLSWIRHLENDGNPLLAKIPILFKFISIQSNALIVAAAEENSAG